MGTVFVQVDNDRQGAVNRVALLYFVLTLANLSAVRKLVPLHAYGYQQQRCVCVFLTMTPLPNSWRD